MNRTNTIKYALAEDDYTFQQIIKTQFSYKPFYNLAFCANNGYELINLISQNMPDIVFIDLFMPVISGLEAVKIIRKLNREVPIIAYSSVYQSDIAQILQDHKINVYCENQFEVIYNFAEQLMKSRRNQFQALYNPYSKDWRSRSSEQLKEFKLNSRKKPLQFSGMELQLMILTCDGFTAKEIGTHLNLSFRTVDTYLNRLQEKLQLRNKTELVKYAFQHGICKLNCELGKSGKCVRKSIFDVKVDQDSDHILKSDI